MRPSSTFDLSTRDAKITGLARRFDFTISIPSNNSYHLLTKKPAANSIGLLAHEWTHYLQYISTSLGSYLAETDRQILAAKLNLVLHTYAALGEVPSAPLVDQIDGDRRLRAASIQRFVTLLKTLVGDHSTLSASWNVDFTFPLFSLQRLRDEKPFSFDEETCSFLYSDVRGEKHAFQITALQILEHAAIANELIVEGFQLDLTYLSPKMLDYFAFYLYLYQEGFLSIYVDEQQGKLLFAANDFDGITLEGNTIRLSGTNDVAAVVMQAYTICQLALMSYERDDSDTAGNEMVQAIATFAERRMQVSARTLINLLTNFAWMRDILATDNDKASTSLFETLDAICQGVKVGKYSEMVKSQLSRAIKGEEMARLSDSPFSISFDDNVDSGREEPFEGSFEGNYFRRSVLAFKALSEEENANINPLMYADKIPSPYVMVDDGSQTRRVIFSFPWQKSPAILRIPSSTLSYYREMSMLLDKRIFDSDLACYRSGDSKEIARSQRASFGCPHFDSCYAKKKERLDEFCDFEEWKRIAAGMIAFFQRGGEVLRDRHQLL